MTGAATPSGRGAEAAPGDGKTGVGATGLRFAQGLRGGRVALVQVSDFSLGRGKFLAAALEKLGLDVVTITNAPVYQSRADGEEGHGRREAKVRVPFAKTLYGSVPGRLLYYLAFSVLTFRELVKHRPRVLYSRGPYPFTEITGQAYRRLFPGAVIVSDTTDLWPDSIQFVSLRPAFKSLLLKFGLAVSRAAYKNVDAIVTHNEPLARVLEERFHRPTRIIYGAIDTSEFGRVGREEAMGLLGSRVDGLDSKFVVLYAGLLGPFQNPRALPEVAERLEDGSVLLVAGRGPMEKEVRDRSSAAGQGKIVFMGTLPFEAMPYLYGAADVCLLTYPDLPFLKIGLPKKFIEYAASRKPILCMAPECVAKEMCEEWGAGIGVGPDDYDGAAEAVARLRRDPELAGRMGGNARRMAQEMFSEEVASRTLAQVLASACEGRDGK